MKRHRLSIQSIINNTPANTNNANSQTNLSSNNNQGNSNWSNWYEKLIHEIKMMLDK